MSANPANRLVRWIQREKQQASLHIIKWREQAKEAYRFRDGQQLSDVDTRQLESEQRPHNAFNAVQKFIRFVVGVESNSPEALLFEPINENDEAQQGYGEFITRAYEWAITKGNGHFERSRAFEDLICTGVGWLDYYVDTHRDPRGLPKQVRIPYDEMWWARSSLQRCKRAAKS